jgi:inorganic pyrophosphatase
MSALREAARQALEALQNCANGEDDVLLTRDALAELRAALAQPEQKPTWRLSCGCPSQYGGIPAEWSETTREGDPAVAYGVVCEKHWHEYEARCPDCARLEAQNTELDRKLAAQPERRLTDEVIADLWHANGGFHHHFARHIERWIKG